MSDLKKRQVKVCETLYGCMMERNDVRVTLGFNNFQHQPVVVGTVSSVDDDYNTFEINGVIYKSIDVCAVDVIIPKLRF